MKFFDDTSKKAIHGWNRNWFFSGTIFIVIVNILIFAFLKKNYDAFHFSMMNRSNSNWSIGNNLIKIFLGFCNSFLHVDWQHVLLNMLCFLVCGLYLERKTGSIHIILLVIAMAFFTSTAMGTAYSSVGGYGFSGANFGFYSYILVDYIFSFQKEKRNRINIVFGAIVIVLMYLAMCYNSGASSFRFEWYPYDLIKHSGHFSGFIAGIFVGLTIQLAQLKAKKETLIESENNVNEENNFNL